MVSSATSTHTLHLSLKGGQVLEAVGVLVRTKHYCTAKVRRYRYYPARTKESTCKERVAMVSPCTMPSYCSYRSTRSEHRGRLCGRVAFSMQPYKHGFMLSRWTSGSDCSIGWKKSRVGRGRGRRGEGVCHAKTPNAVKLYCRQKSRRGPDCFSSVSLDARSSFAPLRALPTPMSSSPLSTLPSSPLYLLPLAHHLVILTAPYRSA